RNTPHANHIVIIDNTTPPVTPTLVYVPSPSNAIETSLESTRIFSRSVTGTTSDPLTYNTQGTHVIHWTFNDGNGNSTTANQNVRSEERRVGKERRSGREPDHEKKK